VGVSPAGAAAHARLLAALEAVEPVVFAAAGDDALDAMLLLGADEAPPGARLPWLRLAGTTAQDDSAERLLVFGGPESGLERVLHGARLHERGAGVLAPPGPGAVVLATSEAGPAWCRQDGGETVAAALGELDDGEALRDHLMPGRCLALLALTHFVRALAGDRGWRPPPPAAAFVLDDPNLHWPSYGHVTYPTLVEHAREHRYHMVIAMVPLDTWFTHPRAARCFRAAPDVLSVAIHGNDHVGPELGALGSDAAARAVVGQALARMATFERRTRIPVSPVMVPPHERVGAHAGAAIAAAGYDALCTTRPYPWVAESGDVHWLSRPAGAGPGAGWGVADVVTGDLPVLLRIDFGHPFEEVVLRAFLGQAVILYGHHDDLREGYGALARHADAINALGDVRWGSLGDLAASRFRVRREGDALAVQLCARRAQVTLPGDVAQLRVDAAAFSDGARVSAAVDGGTAQPVPAGGIVAARPGAAIDLRVAPAATATDGDAAATRARLWPVARRLASESRDRLQGVRQS
jgi:hypothetical protein